MPLTEKQLYINTLHNLLLERIDTLQNELKEVITSRDNESKSSVGDKYETGRAMMQLRQEQLEKQLAEQKKELSLAQAIFSRKPSTTIGEGSLVKTNYGDYLIGIGLGAIRTEQIDFFSISLGSPFGQILRNKKVNEEFEFRSRSYRISEIL